MTELLETDFAVAKKDRLYRCLDRLLEHKTGTVSTPAAAMTGSVRRAF
jgi:hypothetical protein